MQTFLPYPDFARSAQALDMRRLGKQRVEVLQILGTLCEARPVHASHRSNLLRKDATWYEQFDWREGPGLPYVWPV